MILHQLTIPSPDGTIEAQLVRPETSEPLPGVIQLTDGLGFRQAHAELSQRIAQGGYVVLTPNIYYRTTTLPPFDFPPDFANEQTQNRFRELTSPLTPDAMARDANTYVDFLASQPYVSSGPMAAVGFCFSGKFSLAVAAARPDRIAAAASFHGGGLVTDTPESPHLLLPKVRARLYFGHAENDRSMPVEAIATLEQALDEWGGEYQSEMYQARHGWMIAGREVYNEQEAERGLANLMSLLDGTLRAPAGAR